MKTEDMRSRHRDYRRITHHATVLVGLVLLLSSCATLQQNPQWRVDAAQAVTCTRGADCEAKWNRALTWMENNAKAPISIFDDTLISTEIPDDSSHALLSVTKDETAAGTYIIHFRGHCSSLLGCRPGVLELKASFVNYVLKTSSSGDVSSLRTGKEREKARPKADLGAVAIKTNQAAAQKLGMKETGGVRIIYIGPSGAAFDSGLLLDDVILKFAGRTINDVDDLDAALEQITPPRKVPATIWRAGTGESALSVIFSKD